MSYKILSYKNQYQNRITGSKVTAILLCEWILPIGGASSGRVCSCSLRSRLVCLANEFVDACSMVTRKLFGVVAMTHGYKEILKVLAMTHGNEESLRVVAMTHGY